MARRKATFNVPINWKTPDKKFGESVKENLDVLLGHRGSPLERAVTFRDLLDNNVLSLAGNASLSTAGDDPSNFVVPDPSTDNVQQPPQPTGLSASGAFQNIILTWDLQSYIGHSHVQVFRHTSDSISDATMIAQVSGFTGVYSDAVGSNAAFYYWVRAVNIIDDIGPFNSSTGTLGTTQPDVELILDLLEDQITSSELAQSLAEPIGRIDTIDGLAQALETYTGYISSYSGNSLISRIEGTETTATAANTLAGNLETFTGYLSSYSGSTLLSRIGSAETTVSGHTTSISTINSSITSINNSISSLNTATSNLQTSLSDLSANTADVYIQATAPTGTIADNSRWYDTSDNNELHIYFDGDNDGTKEWVAVSDPRIESNETAVADLETEVFNSDGSSRLATASALSTLNTTVINQGSSITSLTTDVTSLENEVFNTDGTSRLATASALSATNTTVSTQGGNITSLQTDVTSLNGAVFDANNNVKLATTTALNSLTSDVEAIYDGTNPSIVKTIQADITSLEGEVFNSDGTARLATSSALSTLSGTVTTQGNNLSTAQGDITSLEGAVFNTDGTVKLASATSVTALTNTVNSQGGDIGTLQGDVTSLESEVFNSDGTSRLATGSSVSSLSNTVSTQGGNISTLQTDVADLEGAVFNSDGTVKLATTSALSGLTNEVEAIYDGNNPSIITTIQSDITSLESQVFNSDGTARLATASALSGVSSSVSSNSGSITTIQGDITTLEAEVFNSDGTSRLATGSALTSLSNDVLAIYDPNSDSTILGSVQQDVTALEGAVFDSGGNVQLASSTAVTLLNNEVWGNGVTPSGATSSRIDSLNSAITNPTTGLSALSGALSTLNTEVLPNGTASTSRIDALDTAVFDSNGNVKLASASAVSTLETEVFGSGGASASRIDGLFAEVFNSDGSARLATASALTTLNTQVNGSGAISDKVDNIAASMFVNGDTNGTLKLATSAALNTVTAEVFPDGTSSTSRLDQLSSAIWSGGDPDNALILASADVVSDIQAEVFPNGLSSASRIDTLQVTVSGADGNSGLQGSIQTLQEVVGDETEGLSSQYSVKLDNNGYIAGFGLSNTVNDGTPTSAFIVRADKFAIVNPAANNEQTNSPSSSANLTVPFVVQTSQTTLNGENVPAGVYMDTAFLKNGSITNAFIGDAAIDNAKISNLSADKITAGTISTSRLKIDNTTLTSDPVTGALKVDAINANQITAGSISATVMSGTTVYAEKLTGDVSIMNSFRDTTLQSFAGVANTGTYGGELTFLESQLDATSHTTVGHTPYAQASGWFESTSGKTYRIQMWMKDNSNASQTLGSPTSVVTQAGSKGSPTLYYMVFSGDKRGLAAQGNVLSNGSVTATINSAIYDSSSTSTRIYHSAASFSTSNTITVQSSSNFQLVGETRFKASTNLYMPYSISGTLGRRTVGTVDLKLVMARYGSSGVSYPDTGSSVDRIGEVNGMIIGMR